MLTSFSQAPRRANCYLRRFQPSKYWPLSTSCKTEHGPIASRHSPDKRLRHARLGSHQQTSLFCPPSQLLKIGRSDHYAVLIKPDATRLNRKTEKKYIMRRDLRESSLCALGRWLTHFSWEPVLNLPNAKDKTETFYNTLIKAIDTLMPTQKVKVCSSDKLWVSSIMKALVYRIQWAFKTHGKDSAVFKMYRNKVQKSGTVRDLTTVLRSRPLRKLRYRNGGWR